MNILKILRSGFQISGLPRCSLRKTCVSWKNLIQTVSSNRRKGSLGLETTFIIFIILFSAGCAVVAPDEVTKIRPFPQGGEAIDKVVTIGVILDNRFPFLLGREEGIKAKTPEEQTGQPSIIYRDQKELKDPLASTKEVKIPMGEVRSAIANAFVKSGRFRGIINPPTALTGETLPLMLKKALETSDYLIVGEVNKFYVKNMGRNWKVNITYPIDGTILAVPNVVWYLITRQRYFVLTGGVIAVDTAGCELSLSLTVYSVETGNAITTLRIEELATTPVDVFMIYGDLNNDDDDWVDIGRQLGEVALTNASIKASEEVAQILSLSAKKQKEK